MLISNHRILKLAWIYCLRYPVKMPAAVSKTPHAILEFAADAWREFGATDLWKEVAWSGSRLKTQDGETKRWPLMAPLTAAHRSFAIRDFTT
jgi:hypothetical protein